MIHPYANRPPDHARITLPVPRRPLVLVPAHRQEGQLLELVVALLVLVSVVGGFVLLGDVLATAVRPLAVVVAAEAGR